MNWALTILLASLLCLPHVHALSADYAGEKLTVVIIHAVLMVWVWMIVVPIGMIIARYLPAWTSRPWYRKHVLVMLIAGAIPFIVGSVMGSQSQSHNHNVSTIHHNIGSLVIGLFVLQALLGYFNHWDNVRKWMAVAPWYHGIHHWLGRITTLLALANIPLGFQYLQIGNWPYISWAIIVGVIMSALLGLELRYGNARKAKRERDFYKAASEVPMAPQNGPVPQYEPGGVHINGLNQDQTV
ncbi:hypothetical protein BZG36_02825 [Bifiguratus adelaidae]|uniref:Cytochrome b561 domain-containing protein n=1 Tax=Bifiguratus adelaidae TaxID=1938954 RepID=A0A261Y0J1_9FUNG|nr:hypothetical protein BZG36_02825 [Bifiguratus adelaidae]